MINMKIDKDNIFNVEYGDDEYIRFGENIWYKWYGCTLKLHRDVELEKVYQDTLNSDKVIGKENINLPIHYCYDPINGMAFPDGLAESTVKQHLNQPILMNGERYFRVSSECIIDALRCLVKEGYVSHENIKLTFRIDGHENSVELNKDGRYLSRNFLPTPNDKLLERLL